MDLSFLGPSAAAVIVVGLFLKYLVSVNTSQASRDRAFASALDKLTKSNEKIATATNKSAKEAEKRNGHLAELAIENKKTTLIAIAELKKTNNVTTQHIDKQVIENSKVMNNKGQ